LTSLLQQKRDTKQPEPKATVAPAPRIGVKAAGADSRPRLFDVESSLGSRAFNKEGDDSVGELIYKALAPGSNVDFPMITDICDRISKAPREAAEAVRCLHGACADRNGPPRRKLKALTIMHELMYDQRVACELRGVHGARETLWVLQGTYNTGLGDSADEQIRMFATEVERTCFDSPSASEPSPALGLRASPLGALDAPEAAGAVTASASFAAPPRERKRDQAMDKLWQIGSVVQANLVAAGAAAQTNLAAAQEAAKTNFGQGSMASLLPAGVKIGGQGGQSRADIPRLPVNPEAQRPTVNITFDGMLAGEIVHNVVKDAYLLISNPLSETRGRLLVTNYRLKFQCQRGALRDELSWILERQFLDVPMGAIEDLRLDHSISEAGAKEWKLRIVTKDLRSINLLLPESQDLAVVEEAAAALGCPGHHYTACLFAFRHAEEVWAGSAARGRTGWSLYDPCHEYSRMGIDTPKAPVDASPWSVCDINNGHRLCETYPNWLVKPRSVSDQELHAVANFRKRHRLPTMSWCAGPLRGFASLWRSSQPTEGILGKSCYEDQNLVSAIRHGAAAGKDRPLLVVDLRKWKAAYANKVGGGGFEAYDGCQVVFGGIDNIHGVREAWRAMSQAVSSVSKHEVGSWFKDVANSGWYDILGTILHCVNLVIRELDMHCCNTLIHCSDGWDRTAQVSSLVMLCMDPHYRTISGLLILIQKEFCSFGHCFRTRLANGEKVSNEFSPVFLQWLECIYQLTIQFPSAFEFTAALLLFIGKEAISNRYGTFLTDSEKERTEKVQPHTLSLWSAILDAGPATEHINPEYRLRDETLHPSPTMLNFNVWREYWFRYHVHP